MFNTFGNILFQDDTGCCTRPGIGNSDRQWYFLSNQRYFGAVVFNYQNRFGGNRSYRHFSLKCNRRNAANFTLYQGH